MSAPSTASALVFQPQLLAPDSAHPQPVLPANGTNFELEELYRLLDCSSVDVVRLTEELILIIDDEGKFRTPAYLNLLASYLWHTYQPSARGVDTIVGRAIYCHTSQLQ